MSSAIPQSGNDRDALRHDRTGKVRKLLKKREELERKAQEDREKLDALAKRRKLNPDAGKQGLESMGAGGFTKSRAEALEEEFGNQTIGLVTADEFREKRRALDELIEKAMREEAKETGPRSAVQNVVKKSQLSFGDEESDEEEDEEEMNLVHRGAVRGEQGSSASASAAGAAPGEASLGGGAGPGGAAAGTTSSSAAAPTTTFKMGKNPNADTSFLHDANREKQLEDKKRQLVEEYKRTEAERKKEPMEITYSYWDGSGHRRSTTMTKGSTVLQFLRKARDELAEDFAELRVATAEDLVFVKEDLILPGSITFYELARDEVRGKTGAALFKFKVSDGNITGKHDIRAKRKEGHAAKIVKREWYDKHKHVFPQSKWEKFDDFISTRKK